MRRFCWASISATGIFAPRHLPRWCSVSARSSSPAICWPAIISATGCFPMAAPLGGTGMMLGWLVMAVGAFFRVPEA